MVRQTHQLGAATVIGVFCKKYEAQCVNVKKVCDPLATRVGINECVQYEDGVPVVKLDRMLL